MTYHVRFYRWKDVSTGFMHEDKYQDHWSVVLAFWSDFFYKNSNSAHSILKSSNFIQRSFICCRGYKTGRICLTFFIFKDGERYTYSVKWFRFIVNIYMALRNVMILNFVFYCCTLPIWSHYKSSVLWVLCSL